MSVTSPAGTDGTKELAERPPANHQNTPVDLRQRVDELEAVLRDRMLELKDATVDRRHLQVDLMVKDGYIAELRQAVQTAEANQLKLQAEFEPLRQLEAAHAAELVDLRNEMVRFGLVRYRLVDKLNAWLLKIKPVHHLLKASVRAANRLRGRPRAAGN